MIDICNLHLNSRTVFFADDGLLILTAENLAQLYYLINKDLELVGSTYNQNRLVLNEDKCNYILFCTNQRNKLINFTIENQHFKVLLNGKSIERKLSVKYLGITLTSNLSWDEHVTNLKKKCSRHIGIIGKLRHYLPLSILKIYFYANVQSHLLYGITIWCSTYNTQVKDLEVLIRRSVRIMLCFNSRTNVDANMLELNIKTLNVLWFQATAIMMYRIMNNYYHNSSNFKNSLLVFPNRRVLRTNVKINNVHIEPYHTNFGKFSFKNVSARVWNYINETYSTKNNFCSFKLKLKEINWANLNL